MENFANILFLFNQETRRFIRNIENIEKKFINCQPAVVFNETRLNEDIEKKLINCQLAVVFNETRLKEDILPIYTNRYIYIYTQSVADGVILAITLKQMLNKFSRGYTIKLNTK